jgi:hypothetical protein
MDWVATIWVVDSDHYQPSAGNCPPDHLNRLAIWKFGLVPTGVVKRLFDLRNRNVPFGMTGTEVPTVGGIPDDRPIVHPLSVYEMDGQNGVASGIRTRDSQIHNLVLYHAEL